MSWLSSSALSLRSHLLLLLLLNYTVLNRLPCCLLGRFLCRSLESSILIYYLVSGRLICLRHTVHLLLSRHAETCSHDWRWHTRAVSGGIADFMTLFRSSSSSEINLLIQNRIRYVSSNVLSCCYHRIASLWNSLMLVLLVLLSHVPVSSLFANKLLIWVLFRRIHVSAVRTLITLVMSLLLLLKNTIICSFSNTLVLRLHNRVSGTRIHSKLKLGISSDKLVIVLVLFVLVNLILRSLLLTFSYLVTQLFSVKNIHLFLLFLHVLLLFDTWLRAKSHSFVCIRWRNRTVLKLYLRIKSFMHNLPP